jgi:cystathionine gamma-synthase
MYDPLSTRSVHGDGGEPHPYGALAFPIVQTSTFTFRDTAAVLEFMRRKAAKDPALRDEYGRYSNPTARAAEATLAALEGGEQALLFTSGMAAITTTLLSLLARGDHLILVEGCYRRTADFARQFLPRWGVDVTFVPPDRPADWEAAVRPETRVLFAETPSNPYLRVADLDQLAALARRRGLRTVVDSTFATPVNLRPLQHGIDLVVHSATKYLGGHNDLLAGAVIGSRELLTPVTEARGVLGGVVSPHDAYLLRRGLKTLDLRVRRQNESAFRLACFLDAHPAVRRAHYPGLPGHPDHETAARLLSGYGGVVSFEIAGDLETTGRFVDALRIPFIGPTLGGVESIVQQPALFVSLDPAERRASGLSDNLVRYAVGIEDADDLVDDLAQALETVDPAGRRRP